MRFARETIGTPGRLLLAEGNLLLKFAYRGSAPPRKPMQPRMGARRSLAADCHFLLLGKAASARG